jgi:hypothetical protein
MKTENLHPSRAIKFKNKQENSKLVSQELISARGKGKKIYVSGRRLLETKHKNKQSAFSDAYRANRVRYYDLCCAKHRSAGGDQRDDNNEKRFNFPC